MEMTDTERIEIHTEKADSSHVVEKVWPDLTQEEVDSLLDLYTELNGPYKILHYSSRPLSAASLVETNDRVVLVKRHAGAVRSVESLNEEHDLIRHLRTHGLETPRVYRTESGQSAVGRPESNGNAWTYEVFDRAAGEDRYRGRDTWTPLDSLDDAYSAGVSLGKLHKAAADYEAPTRQPAVLTSGLEIFGWSVNPEEAIERRSHEIPGLAEYLRNRSWKKDLQHHFDLAQRLHEELRYLPEGWTQNDFHSSNLFWDGSSVVSIIDFGLSNRSTRLLDLAIAIERNTILWQELLAGDDRAYRLDQTKEILDGYRSEVNLPENELMALPLVLQLCQADAAINALAYYAGILKDKAMADWGYDSFLLDHTLWFDTTAGQRYIEKLAALL